MFPPKAIPMQFVKQNMPSGWDLTQTHASMPFLFNSQPFFELLLITIVTKTLECVSTWEALFSPQFKDYFLPHVVCVLWCSSFSFLFSHFLPYLFLTFFFLCLSYFPAVSFILDLESLVKSWLSRMQGRVGSLSVSHFAEMSQSFFFFFLAFHVHLPAFQRGLYYFSACWYQLNQANSRLF